MSLVSDLITNIRTESRVPGTDNLDSWILDIINQVTLNYAEKGMLRQILIKDYGITLVNAQESYPLPDDYLKMLRVFYVTTVDATSINWQMYERKGLQQPAKVDGKPSTYELIQLTEDEITTQVINLTPSSAILAIDGLSLDYYQKPAILEAGDEYPFPGLEPAVIQDSVARLQLFHETLEIAQAQSQAAQSKFAEAAPTTM